MKTTSSQSADRTNLDLDTLEPVVGESLGEVRGDDGVDDSWRDRNRGDETEFLGELVELGAVETHSPGEESLGGRALSGSSARETRADRVDRGPSHWSILTAR